VAQDQTGFNSFYFYRLDPAWSLAQHSGKADRSSMHAWIFAQWQDNYNCKWEKEKLTWFAGDEADGDGALVGQRFLIPFCFCFRFSPIVLLSGFSVFLCFWLSLYGLSSVFFSWVLCFFSCLLFSLFSSWSPCSGPSLDFYRPKNIKSHPYLPGDGDEDHYYFCSVFGWNENTNSPAIVGLLVINFILAPEAHRRDEENWNTRAICGRQPGLWFWLGFGEISEGIGSGRCHFWQFSRTIFLCFGGRGEWTVDFKTASFTRLKCLSSICPLTSWHLAIKPLFMEIFLSFLISPLDQLQLDPGFQRHLHNSPWFQV